MQPLFFDPAEPICGFTFQQPFATAIIGMPGIDATWGAKSEVSGPKRTENRGYPPPRTRPLPFWLAVHAGATFYPGVAWPDFGMAHGRIPPIWPDCPQFATMPQRVIVGLARVTGAVAYRPASTTLFPFERAEAERRVKADPWAFGPWCWILDPTVVQLAEPLPWPKGALGLWTVPPETLALLTAAREDRALWKTA